MITPSGKITELSDLSDDEAEPRGIALGSDHEIWFTEWNYSTILRYDPDFTHSFSIPSGDYADPRGIAPGPDGALWFTEFGTGNNIGRITVAGDVTEFPLPTPNASVIGIVEGPRWRMWFTETIAGKIGRITTTGKITEFPLRPSTEPLGIATGHDGNLWFSDAVLGLIARITPSGTVSEFELATDSEPRARQNRYCDRAHGTPALAG